MALEPEAVQERLGAVGHTEIVVVQTEAPWDLDADTFLLSMGSGFGGLAQGIRRYYPDARWASVNLPRLRPDKPMALRLTPEDAAPTWAILATVHPDPVLQPTRSEVLEAIPVALQAAMSLVSQLRTRTLVVPLLGAGRLGVPVPAVAEQIVLALNGFAELLGRSRELSRIVLLAQDSDDAAVIERTWAKIAGAPAAAPASASSDSAGPPAAASVDVAPPAAGSPPPWLAPTARAALAYADGLRRTLGRSKVHMEHLMLGLDQADASVHRLLEESGLPRKDLLDVIASETSLRTIPPVTPGNLEGLPPLSDHASEALEAARSREHDGVVDAAGLLQGALTVACKLTRAILRRAPDLARQAGVETELVGGLAADLVNPDEGIPLTEDALGLETYVQMMAAAIARQDTKLPLSIGLFGEWGSGKSYFMGLLRAEVEKLAAKGKPVYHSGVVQIGFNAWSYADTNLWASLGDEIFRTLAGPAENEAEDLQRRRERLRTWLAESEGRLQELEAARAAASSEVARLRSELETQRIDRTASAKQLLQATIEAASANPEVRSNLDDAWSKLGIKDEAQQALVLADAVTGVDTDLGWVRRNGSSGLRYVVIAVAVLGVVLLGSAPAASGAGSQWLARSGALTLLAAAGTLAALMARVAKGARIVTGFAEDIRRREQVGKDRKVAEALMSVRNAEAREQVAQAQLDEVVARVGELGRELVALSPGQRMYAFLAERAASDDYRGRLGLVATIRRDFERLAELQDQWRKNPSKDSPPPIDRIVLYIDDLDRCTPGQVVDVLQAVHLLLALDLFVVVVGVDPRWLLHSLRDQYRSLLSGGRSANRTPDDAAAGADGAAAMEEGLTELEADQLLLTTPQDYLEKIFNVPFVLPAMTPEGFDTMIRRLSRYEDTEQTGHGEPSGNRSDHEPGEQTPDVHLPPGPRPPSETVTKGPAPAIEKDSELEHNRRGITVVPKPLSEPELKMLGSLASLVRSPREAKRLLNLYRMLRSTRNLSDASRFLGDKDAPGQFQAIAVLLGFLTANPRLLGQILFTPPDADTQVLGGICSRNASGTWSELLEGLRPRLEGERWRNDVSACLSTAERAEWELLLSRAKAASDEAHLSDLSALKEWAPHIARFSFVLAPATRSSTR